MIENFLLKTTTRLLLLFCTIATSASANDWSMDSYIETCNNGQFHVNADWLYWKAQQDNLLIARFVDDFPDPTLKTVDVALLQPIFKFDNGFRLNAGYQAFCSPWEFNITYTHLRFKAKPFFVHAISDP